MLILENAKQTIQWGIWFVHIFFKQVGFFGAVSFLFHQIVGICLNFWRPRTIFATLKGLALVINRLIYWTFWLALWWANQVKEYLHTF